VSMARDPYRYFRIEAREILDALGQGAFEIHEGRSAPELVGRLLRVAHTLKGASRVVKQAEMAALAHQVEEQLAPHHATGAVPKESAREVLRLQREMGALLAGLDAPAPAAADGEPRSQPAAPVQAIAVDVEETDAILRILAEQSSHRAGRQKGAEALEQASRLAAVLARELGARRAGAGDGAAPSRALAVAEDLLALLARVRRAIATAAEQADRDHAELLAAAERMRLAPTSALFGPLERAIRDAALALGKRVELVASGGENRLDAGVLAPLRQALLHIVRNAVAHGIEAPSERIAAGKSEVGKVELSIERRSDGLAFVCRDDGRGMDAAAVRRAAVERGIIGAEEAARLDPAQALRLALRAGVSTSRSVSEVSGRGVGLDVVREIASRLQGEVSLRSEPGKGTAIELRVPVTLSSMRVLLVEAGGVRAALPLSAVRHTFRVARDELPPSAAKALVFDGSEAIPFLSIASALARGPAPVPSARGCSAVAIDDGAGRVAVGVDRLLGVESVLVRPLPPLTPRSPFVAGVSLDARGAPVLVLDPEGLAPAARARPAEPVAPATRMGAPVLVIDDSLTTRMLEQSILESAGYEVDVAVSAEEALAKAADRRYALFLVDVEMPGMDGFEFVSRTRADAALRDTPAIMVTSRGSPQDRRRGEEAGARAYLVKSEFDQVQLLRTIRELVG
jgi:two-component system, chemotaxis family, sensor kinase CheA